MTQTSSPSTKTLRLSAPVTIWLRVREREIVQQGLQARLRCRPWRIPRAEGTGDAEAEHRRDASLIHQSVMPLRLLPETELVRLGLSCHDAPRMTGGHR